MKRLNGTLVALGLGAVLGLGGSLGFTTESTPPAGPESICYPYNCHDDAECVKRCGVGSVCLKPNTCQSSCLCVIQPE